MSDTGLKGSRTPRPRQNKAKPGDTVLPFTCPDCGKQHYIWIDVQSIPELERDELGQLVLDENGQPKEKLRVSHSYISVPRVHPAWSPEIEEELKVLYERSKAERDFAAKPKKDKLVAEIAA
jgi:hypothetical protein